MDRMIYLYEWSDSIGNEAALQFFQPSDSRNSTAGPSLKDLWVVAP
jgi:hypothetical protein